MGEYSDRYARALGGGVGAGLGGMIGSTALVPLEPTWLTVGLSAGAGWLLGSVQDTSSTSAATRRAPAASGSCGRPGAAG